MIGRKLPKLRPARSNFISRSLTKFVLLYVYVLLLVWCVCTFIDSSEYMYVGCIRARCGKRSDMRSVYTAIACSRPKIALFDDSISH